MGRTGIGSDCDRMETEFIALNLTRTKFMLSIKKEARNGKTDALVTCTIYVASNHRLYVLELFKVDRDGIKSNCKVELLTNCILQTISV